MQRHRDVVLDRAALEALHLRQRLAQLPEGGALLERAGERRVGDEARSPAPRRGRSRPPRRARPRLCAETSISTYQGEGSASGSRVPAAWRSTNSRPMRGISSKVVSVPPAPRLGGVEQGQRRFRRRHGEEGRGARRRQREELQHGGGDDAERAFRADEEVLQVVAGVVLAQLAQAVPDAAVGQHDLEPHAELAGIAIGEHGGAAGIGREIAADRAGAFRGEREREEPAGRLGRLLRALERDAGLDGHGVALRHRRRGSCRAAAARG